MIPKKNIVSISIIIVMVLSTLQFLAPPIVGGSGNYSSIQHAINDADPGDTVFVHSGIYYENLVIDKSINLVGENRNNTILDGDKKDNVIQITADGVTISNLTITNSTTEIRKGGIYLRSNYSTIENCIINRCQLHAHGIYMKNSSFCSINNCIIYKNNYDVVLSHSSNNSIASCHIGYDSRQGVIFSWDSNYNKLFESVINGCGCGVHIYGGVICDYNQIYNNTIFDNDAGIVLFAGHNTIVGNTIENSTRAAIRVWDNNRNIIYHNNFINNPVISLIEHRGTNIWDNGYPSGGNYWSDYNGIDDNGDGIGDTPYTIKPFRTNDDEQWDRYPLMNPINISTRTPKYVYVNNGFNDTIRGWNYDHFNTIQDGIDFVDENGTVYVFNGIYYENVIVNKPVNLVGEDRSKTAIDGNNENGNVVRISSDYASIKRLTVRNSEGNGIYLDSASYNLIEDCTVFNASQGISFHSSSDNTLLGCSINNNSDGIEIRGSNNILVNCSIRDNTDYGIYIQHVSSSNKIYHNNFVDNANQSYDEGNNIWDNGYPIGGNYWNDYAGSDNYQGLNQVIVGGDDIGDTPYHILGGETMDNFPLMNLWEGTLIYPTPYHVYVDGTYDFFTPGWNYDHFNTIQDGIDAVELNGTVFVYNGTYYECITINKQIILTGEDKLSTIIDGGSGDHIVILTADNCTFKGFSVRCENTSHSCIKIMSNNSRIKNNDFSNYNSVGIRMWGANNNTIVSNIINNNGNGMSLKHCHNNIIENNIINDHRNHGIGFTCASKNIISNNTVNGNYEGLSCGDTTWNNTIVGNTITNNSGYGIYFLGNNTIYHNNFINNSDNAYGRPNANTWYSLTLLEGNYWSDYEGTDSDGDGIGDTPYYNIKGDSNKDLYPLMRPYNPITAIVEFQAIEPLYTTEYIELSISVNPSEPIAGVQFDISFDPSMLSIEWVAEGNFFSEYDAYFDPGIIDNTNGTLKDVVSLMTTPGGGTTNQGSIAVMSIRAKTITGETPLNLSNVIVGGPDGTPIDVSIINTTVMIYHHDRWDVNWDDHVNILDLILIGQWWDKTGTPGWVSTDVNCDGVINILDMVLVGQHWTG